MASIAQIVAQIRTAVFGREVRSAIAEGIEKCYNDVTSGVTTADSAAAKINDMTVAASQLGEGSSPTATVSEVSGHKHIAFGIPIGNTGNGISSASLGSDYKLTLHFTDGTSYTTDSSIRGAKGATGSTGAAASISNQQTTYNVSSSGSTAPSTGWSTTVPIVNPGDYLWIKHTITWNNGSTSEVVFAARYGINGLGSVTAVSMNGSAAPMSSSGVVDLGTVITDVSGKVDKSGVADQWINSGSASTQLGVSCSTSGNTTFIRADNEGGNVQIKKGNNCLAEFDTYSMNTSSTGYARIFTSTGTSGNTTIKEFKFKQSGDFEDGNGLSLGTLNNNKLPESSFAIVEKGSVATHNITAGQYVEWNGSLCVATQNISTGIALSSSNLSNASTGNGGMNVIKDILNSAILVKQYGCIYNASGNVIQKGGVVYVTVSQLHVSVPDGYTIAGVVAVASGSISMAPIIFQPAISSSAYVVGFRNVSDSSNNSELTCKVRIMFVKTELFNFEDTTV